MRIFLNKMKKKLKLNLEEREKSVSQNTHVPDLCKA